MAANGRAAVKGVVKAEEARHHIQEQLHTTTGEPEKLEPGRPAKAAAPLEQGEQDVDAARHAYHRLAGQREQVAQSIRAIGQAYHVVDLERGVRRHGKRIAGDSQAQIDTIRAIARQENLSEACRDRLAKAERVVPQMQATIAFVSGYVRQQVSQ